MKKLIGMSVALFLLCVCISDIYSQTYAPIYATRIELKNGVNRTIINPNASGGTRSISFPTDDPAEGDALTWHTGGLLSWEPASGGGSLTGTGTSGRLARWTGASALGNSVIQDDGTNVGIGITPGVKLDVDGAFAMQADVSISLTGNPAGDSTYLTVGNRSVYIIDSDDQPGDRTLGLSPGIEAGQMLILVCGTGTTDGFRLIDNNVSKASGVNTNGNRSLNHNDSLTLIWNGTHWIEIVFTQSGEPH